MTIATNTSENNQDPELIPGVFIGHDVGFLSDKTVLYTDNTNKFSGIGNWDIKDNFYSVKDQKGNKLKARKLNSEDTFEGPQGTKITFHAHSGNVLKDSDFWAEISPPGQKKLPSGKKEPPDILVTNPSEMAHVFQKCEIEKLYGITAVEIKDGKITSFKVPNVPGEFRIHYDDKGQPDKIFYLSQQEHNHGVFTYDPTTHLWTNDKNDKENKNETKNDFMVDRVTGEVKRAGFVRDQRGKVIQLNGPKLADFGSNDSLSGIPYELANIMSMMDETNGKVNDLLYQGGKGRTQKEIWDKADKYNEESDDKYSTYNQERKTEKENAAAQIPEKDLYSLYGITDPLPEIKDGKLTSRKSTEGEIGQERLAAFQIRGEGNFYVAYHANGTKTITRDYAGEKYTYNPDNHEWEWNAREGVYKHPPQPLTDKEAPIIAALLNTDGKITSMEAKAEEKRVKRKKISEYIQLRPFDITEEKKSEYKIFLKAYPDIIDMKNDNGDTPLMEAVKKGNIQMVYDLIELGADLTTRDKQGNTVLFYAKREKSPMYASLCSLINKNTNTDTDSNTIISKYGVYERTGDRINFTSNSGKITAYCQQEENGEWQWYKEGKKVALTKEQSNVIAQVTLLQNNMKNQAVALAPAPITNAADLPLTTETTLATNQAPIVPKPEQFPSGIEHNNQGRV